MKLSHSLVEPSSDNSSIFETFLPLSNCHTAIFTEKVRISYFWFQYMLRLTRAIDAIEKKGKSMSRYSAPMHWKCSIFAVNESRRFHEVAELCGLCYEESLLGWSGLRGRMRFFRTKNGTFKKSRSSFGKSLLDCDRVAWERCLWIVMKSLIAKHQYFLWQSYLQERDGKHIGWFLDGLFD